MAHGRDTLQINMKAPVADFIAGLGTRYLPIHPRELVDDGSIDARAVGTGPGILTEMVQGSHIALDTNPTTGWASRCSTAWNCNEQSHRAIGCSPSAGSR